ncbi:MAG TPA: YkgJ family cysteine cluster protein [Candidatus Acidoferrum sp.]|nr:YkgJ family cysteine cluster protein [Candidatus Acidoferrum sp.]
MGGPRKLVFEYPRSLNFECERCALCCGNTETRIRRILLLKVEAEHISNKTGKPIAEFADKNEGTEPYVYEMRKNNDGKCAFLKNNACSIYRIRPLICTFYPFELRPSGDNAYVFSYTDECPSIGRGPKLKKEYFKKLFANSKALIE